MGAFTDFYRPIGSNLQIAPFNANATNDSLNEFAKVQMLRKQQDQQRQQEAQRLELDTKRANAEIAAQKARQEIEDQKLARVKKKEEADAKIGERLAWMQDNGHQILPGQREDIAIGMYTNAGLHDEAEAVRQNRVKEFADMARVDPRLARQQWNQQPGNLMNQIPKPPLVHKQAETSAGGVVDIAYDPDTGEEVSRKEIIPPKAQSDIIQSPAFAERKDGRIIWHTAPGYSSGGGRSGGGGGDVFSKDDKVIVADVRDNERQVNHYRQLAKVYAAKGSIKDPDERAIAIRRGLDPDNLPGDSQAAAEFEAAAAAIEGDPEFQANRAYVEAKKKTVRGDFQPPANSGGYGPLSMLYDLIGGRSTRAPTASSSGTDQAKKPAPAPTKPKKRFFYPQTGKVEAR